MQPVLPQNILRNFDLKSAGLQDGGYRDWIASISGIASSSENPLVGATSFLAAVGGSLQSRPISMAGTNTVKASKIQVTFSYKTANAALPTMPIVRCSIAFDGAGVADRTIGISANTSWSQGGFEFDAPLSALTATVTLAYEGGNNAPACFLDDISIVVVANADPNAFLATTYDQVCWLCAHNAFANYQDGWLWAQQSFNVTAQLQQGVRALMLDIDDENNQILLLHAGWLASSVMRPGFQAFRPLAETLTEVNAFLEQNPTEIVTILFETAVKDPSHFQQTVAAFQAAGSPTSNLFQKLFWYNRQTIGSTGQTWNAVLQGAPTLRWMVDNNRRCVVFTSLRGGDTHSIQPTAPDGWAMMWHFNRENVYGDNSLDRSQWCDQRPESLDADVNPQRPLTILNHFPDWAVGSLLPASISFNSINDAEFIGEHVDAWLMKYPRLPNFLAVDYVTTGANGGPLSAVHALNLRWADHDIYLNPPPPGPMLGIDRSLPTVKADLIGTAGTSSLMAVTVNNVAANDFTLLGSHARHGKIVDDLPAVILGASADAVRLANDVGATGCAGVCTTMAGMLGPQCFWLFSTPGAAQVLFIGVSSPYNLLMYNNYANARWVDRSPAIDAFVSTGAGGDDLFDALFTEINDDTSTNPNVRIRARPWICGTWAMRNRTPGDMTVTLWNY